MKVLDQFPRFAAIVALGLACTSLHAAMPVATYRSGQMCAKPVKAALAAQAVKMRAIEKDFSTPASQTSSLVIKELGALDWSNLITTDLDDLQGMIDQRRVTAGQLYQTSAFMQEFIRSYLQVQYYKMEQSERLELLGQMLSYKSARDSVRVLISTMNSIESYIQCVRVPVEASKAVLKAFKVTQRKRRTSRS